MAFIVRRLARGALGKDAAKLVNATQSIAFAASKGFRYSEALVSRGYQGAKNAGTSVKTAVGNMSTGEKITNGVMRGATVVPLLTHRSVRPGGSRRRTMRRSS